MQHQRTLAALASAVFLLAGCGSADDMMPANDADASVPEDGGTPVQAACAWSDFSADVRRGPSAGAHVAGALTLAQVDATTLRGTLTPPGGSPMAVRGELAGRAITLHFPMPQGTITGTGTLSADFARCPVPLRGDLTGPLTGDAGDWIAGVVDASPRCFTYEGADGPAVSCSTGTGMRCVCIYPRNGGAAMCGCYRSNL